MKVWMRITNDEYELPIAVANSAAELGRICGTNANAIRSAISHVKHGRKPFTSFICVEIDDKEGEQDED